MNNVSVSELASQAQPSQPAERSLCPSPLALLCSPANEIRVQFTDVSCVSTWLTETSEVQAWEER